jgi:hypothetical protein
MCCRCCSLLHLGLQIGDKLAHRYSNYLECFVRCYVFNLDDPYEYSNRMPDASFK